MEQIGNKIELKNPLIFDVRIQMQKIVDRFGTTDKFIGWIRAGFGYDKWPFDGTHRYGNDSSTDVSAIKYSTLRIGMELYCYMKPKGYPRCTWVPVRIVHKYHNMVFFECLIDGMITYVDCGADDYWYGKQNAKFEPALPKNKFAPIEVIVPDYVDIKPWCLPKQTIITKC